MVPEIDHIVVRWKISFEKQSSVRVARSVSIFIGRFDFPSVLGVRLNLWFCGPYRSVVVRQAKRGRLISLQCGLQLPGRLTLTTKKKIGNS